MSRWAQLARWVVLGVLLLGLATSCSRSPNVPVSIVDGKTLTQIQIELAVPGKVAASQAMYAEVDSTKLGAYYTHFLSVFSLATGQNAPHWDANASCTAFADLYADLAKCEYYQLEFRTVTQATAPAVGSVWYVKDDNRQGHAIVMVLTERGRLFIEPQTGAVVTLTPAEIASIWHAQF